MHGLIVRWNGQRWLDGWSDWRLDGWTNWQSNEWMDRHTNIVRKYVISALFLRSGWLAVSDGLSPNALLLTGPYCSIQRCLRTMLGWYGAHGDRLVMRILFNFAFGVQTALHHVRLTLTCDDDMGFDRSFVNRSWCSYPASGLPSAFGASCTIALAVKNIYCPNS